MPDRKDKSGVHRSKAEFEKLSSELDEAISASMRAEEALQESENKYRSLTEISTDIIFTLDTKRKFTYISSAIEIVTGFPWKHFIGRSFTEMIAPDYIDSTVDRFNRGLSGEDIPLYEIEVLHKDGGTIPVELNSSSLLDNQGKVCGRIVVGRDITKRRKADERISFLSTVVEQSADGMAIADLEGNLLFVNDSWVSMHGYEKAGELLGHNLSIFHNEKQLKNDVEPFHKKVMENGYYSGEVGHIRQDGTVFPTQMTTTLIRDEKGNAVAIAGVASDITEQIKLESQLRQAQKMESVGRLAGGVAHDFNNMLSVILGNTEMAMEKVDPDQPLYTHLTEIHSATERSADLIRQLLAFARKQTIAPRVLDLNETVEGMLKMLRRLIGENIDLVWMPGAEVWPIKVDPSQIDQIMANLCVNARDAIDGVGRVTIETENATLDEAYCYNYPELAPGEYILLIMSDDGCGMDKETMNVLFEPFFTTKDPGKGTGLGLATVYGIVKQNGGFINVYSEPGQGTTFRIYLPRHTARGDETLKASSTELLRFGCETILLVEDETSILKLITLMLEHKGYIVIAASTPGEAIRLAREHSGDIHLIITDVVMPEMNGRDLVRNLLSIYPSIKRLFMSGYTANVIAHHGVLDEGVHFIQKPFTNQEIVARVREALDSE